MELRRYLEVVKRYWVAFVVIPLLAALVALGATFVVSPRFESAATVQLIPEAIEPRSVSLRNVDGSSMVAVGVSDPTELLAQGVVENLKSRPVAEEIVDQLKLDEPVALTGFNALKAEVRRWLSEAWAFVRYGYVAKGSPRDAAVGAVEGAVRAEPVRGSYFVRIVTTWHDPQVAAAISNVAVQAMVDHVHRVASVSAAEQRRFLEGQAAEARDRATNAREALMRYSRDNSVIAQESLRSALGDLDFARESAQQNELQLADSRRTLQEVQRQIEITPSELVVATSVDETTERGRDGSIQVRSPNPIHQELQQRIQDLEQNVAALEATRNLSEQELRIQNDTKIDELRRRLVEIERQSQQELSGVVKDQLKDRALMLELDLAAREANRNRPLEELRAQNERDLAGQQRRLDTARYQIGRTPSQVVTSESRTGVVNDSRHESRTSGPNPLYQDLQRRAMEIEQDIAALESRQAQLNASLTSRQQDLQKLTVNDSVMSGLSQELQLANELYSRRTAQWQDALLEEARPSSQVRLVDAALAPPYPRQPVKVLWTLVGALAGLGAATALAFVRHTTDVSLRSVADAEKVLQLNSLAVLPASRRKAERKVGKGSSGRSGL